MKLNCLLLLLIAPVGMLPAQDKTPLAKESVSFDGTTLFLVASGENTAERVKEYLPEGQRIEKWTQLASIRDVPKQNDPRAVAENLVRALKQQNPGAQSAIIQNPQTGEVIVDFVTWSPDNAFVEFNIFKYSKKAGGGLLAQQYALREYQDTAAFLNGLKPVRLRLVDLMAKGGLQTKP